MRLIHALRESAIERYQNVYRSYNSQKDPKEKQKLARVLKNLYASAKKDAERWNARVNPPPVL